MIRTKYLPIFWRHPFKRFWWFWLGPSSRCRCLSLSSSSGSPLILSVKPKRQDYVRSDLYEPGDNADSHKRHKGLLRIVTAEIAHFEASGSGSCLSSPSSFFSSPFFPSLFSFFASSFSTSHRFWALSAQLLSFRAALAWL